MRTPRSTVHPLLVLLVGAAAGAAPLAGRSAQALAGPAVIRLAGTDRVETAVAVSRASFPDKAAAGAVVARSDGFADALAGGPLAAATRAPLLLTSPAALDPRTRGEIQRVLAPGRPVLLLGGPSALDHAVADALRALGYDPVRLAGADRYATAVAVADRVTSSPSTVLVADGAGFPDALAAAAAGAGTGAPLVLTDGARMPPSTAAYLSAHPRAARTAIGGPAATADPAAAAVVGADRYDTATRVAAAFFPDAASAGLASGEAFPDALTAGPRAASQGGPVLLSPADELPGVVGQYLAARRTSLAGVTAHGGPAALSERVLVSAANALGAPHVELVSVPPWGSFGSLVGRVHNVDPARYALATYIRVGGWWTKPTFATPTVRPDAQGDFRVAVTTGGADETADVLRVYLVPASYLPPPASGQREVPPAIEQVAVARAEAVRAAPPRRELSFAGRRWLVKASRGPVGPGPNYFSDQPENVFVDTNGLHLRITRRDQRWQCAEVVLDQSLGYGTYRFTLGSSVGALDPTVVLGMFTWSDDPDEAHREIDVEIARWGNAADPTNAQYVVQPYDVPGHLVRFTVPPTSISTHEFTWAPGAVSFRTTAGGQPEFASDLRSSRVPTPGDETPRINLWLDRGRPPTNGEATEVVITDFVFTPR